MQSGQGGQAGDPGLDFCVENALELLDFAGEAFYDVRSGSVYACTASGAAPGDSHVELAVTRYLLSVGAPGGDVVQGVSVRGLGFANTRSTMLEPHDVPGGGDMSAHARGALTVSNAEDVTIAQCSFSNIGGSAVVVAGHALGVQVVDSSVVGAGAHGVLVLGFSQLVDATGANMPRGTRVAGNSISLTGRENKFAAGVAVAIAPRTVVEGNVIYDVARSAVYYNDLSASPAQLLRNNALFNTNRETTDTGPVYTYQRLVFVGDNAAGPSVEPDLSHHEANLIMANYGSFWPLDYDDGSMNIVDSDNVFLYGGSKQYLGRATTHANNYYAYADLSVNWGECARLGRVCACARMGTCGRAHARIRAHMQVCSRVACASGSVHVRASREATHHHPLPSSAPPRPEQASRTASCPSARSSTTAATATSSRTTRASSRTRAATPISTARATSQTRWTPQ
jgi:hypothetical protein